MALGSKSSPCFDDIPYDIQISILSFLHPMKIISIAPTCRSFSVVCNPSSTDLWFAVCHRRWGSKTQIRRWPAIPSHRFYKSLDRWERFIGFWYHRGTTMSGTPSILFFEWGSSCIVGSSIIPSPSSASYSVRKIPFISLNLSPAGEPLSYVIADNPNFDPIPISIKIIKGSRFAIEEIFENNIGSQKSSRKLKNFTSSPRRAWDSQTFSRISSYSPSPTRPLQGLWKGIIEDMNLEFFLVTDNGFEFITYKKLLNTSPDHFSEFWTNGEMSTEPPFSLEEQEIFNTMVHVRSEGSARCNIDSDIVAQILFICNCPGRVWHYSDGTFGFGNLTNNFAVDLRLVARDGHLFDVIE